MNDKAHDETTGLLPRYARVFPHLAKRLPQHVLTMILDPYRTGEPDAAIIENIEDVGSLDLNIALFHAKSQGVIVLEDAAAKCAEIIATDMMLIYVAHIHKDIVSIQTAELSQLCQQRIDALLKSCGHGQKRETQPSAVNGWCMVELMGQHRYSAFVTEVSVAGQPMLRLEIPTDATTPNQRAIKFVGPRAVYAMTPCDETLALRIAHKNMPVPVKSWELDTFPPRTGEARPALQAHEGGEWEESAKEHGADGVLSGETNTVTQPPFEGNGDDTQF